MSGLDLDNFEGEFSRETPFILTSPTSLQACARLGVQPKDLVYRSIEETEEIFSDLPLSQVYKIHEQNETRRQELLLKCRKMRDEVRGSRSNSHSKNVSTPSVKFQEEEHSDTESQSGDRSHKVYSARSLPDLRTNLEFGKVSCSPRSPRCHHCPCQFQFDDERICHSYLKSYCDILAAAEISEEDRKILECLALKKGRALEWEKKAQEVRGRLECERHHRLREEQYLTQRWQQKLAEKRRLENVENTRRYLEIQQKWRHSRENLQKQLEDRDRRVQKYLEELNHQRRLHLLEKQKAESLRQYEVGKAIERLMEEDRVNRQKLRDKLQKRLEDAETRRRRKESDNWRHVQEMNRLEDAKRCLKLEQVEQHARQTVEELRQQIEDKEHRARMNYLALQRLKSNFMCEGSGSRDKAIQKAQLMHSQLLHGLEEWNKKVLELHLAAQDRAESKYLQEVNRRRSRAATERILREERALDTMRKVKETEEKRRELVLHVIDSKENKVARLKAEKERKVQISRVRAQQAAEMRQQLRERLDPETFDKKAARVELEMRVLKKPQTNFSHKFVSRFNVRRCNHCHCRCRRNFYV